MNQKGMNIAELMVATLLMAMVMASVASLNQSFSMQAASLRRGEEILNRKALVALHSLGQKATLATRIDAPQIGTSSNFILAGINVDGSATNNSNPLDGNSADTRWFLYCVSDNNVHGICGTPQSPAPCLFSYEGQGWPPPVAAGAFQTGDCGTTIGGVAPDILASGIACPTGGPNGTPSSCFTRIPAERVPESNEVRVYLSASGKGVGPSQSASVEATFSAQIGN